MIGPIRNRSVAALITGLSAATLFALFTSCAGSRPSQPTVLAAMEEEPEPMRGDRIEQSLAPTLPIELPFRGPDAAGDSYRLVLEISGERTVNVSKDLNERPPLGESHLLEVEFREAATPGDSPRHDTFLVSLDALHYRLVQRNPAARREIELGDDRLRVFKDGEQSLDLRGAQPKGDLTPRKILQRVFATVVHDENGNPKAVAPKGSLVARRFLSSVPLKRAIGYSRIALPNEPISPGSVWHAARFPASRVGELGLLLGIEYSLAGFESIDGVPCAWILLRSKVDADNVRSAAGFTFERVVATLSGMAWVELETSRVRRMVVEDDIRTSYAQGDVNQVEIRHGLRHATRMVLELIDEADSPETWADGSERFGRR